MRHHSSRKSEAKKAALDKQVMENPFAGHPLDGSQYMDVVEEQEYADRRPTAEEQRPRFSYLKLHKN